MSNGYRRLRISITSRFMVVKNDTYSGGELLKALYKCVEGCREWSKLKDSEEYSIAADRTQIFISNLDNYDNID